MEDLDCIMAAVGGGGMISGICVAAKVTITIVTKYIIMCTAYIQLCVNVLTIASPE